MGWLSALADIGLGAAAPFTGGASLAAIPLANMAIGSAQGSGASPTGANSATDLSQLLGKYASGQANGMVNQANVQNNYDKNALQLYQEQQAAAKMGLEAPGYLAGQTARGDLMANLQPASFSGLPSYIHIPTMTGGLTPADLGPNARSAGTNLSQQSLSKLLAGPSSYMPTAPSLTPLPTSSGLAGNLALGLGLAGTAGSDLSKLLAGNSGSGNGVVPGNITDGNIPIDPEAGVSPSTSASQFAGMPGQSDPMADYLAWMQQNQQLGG